MGSIMQVEIVLRNPDCRYKFNAQSLEDIFKIAKQFEFTRVLRMEMSRWDDFKATAPKNLVWADNRLKDM